MTKYLIESAAYKIPIGGPAISKFLEIFSSLPGHMFLALSKREKNGQIIPISALHGLATDISPDENGDLKKTILRIGTQLNHKLVLYHLFNHRDYAAKRRKNPHAQESLLQEEKSMMHMVSLTEQEDNENAKAVDNIMGKGYGYLYWLSLDGGRRVVYGEGEGEDDALKLWAILNDFKECYNQNPGYYPLYGLGTAFLKGSAPLNSNAAFITFAYLLGAPIDKVSSLWVPGLAGMLGLEFPEQLEAWRQLCEVIRNEASLVFEASADTINTAKSSISTEGFATTSESLDAISSLNTHDLNVSVENSLCHNSKWDNDASQESERHQHSNSPNFFAETRLPFDLDTLSSGVSVFTDSDDNEEAAPRILP